MKDIDNILVGTEWIKVTARHNGQKGRIDKVGTGGPRMRFTGLPTNSRHGSRSGGQPLYQRISWFELGNTWMPDGSRSANQYDLWKTAAEIEYLQKERDNTIMTIDPIPASLVEEEVTCTSVYHKPHHGKVARSAAYQTRSGAWNCLECKAKRDNYWTDYKAKRDANKLVVANQPETYVPPVLVIEPGVEVLPEWRVTIIQPTTIVVKAKDLLDIAVQMEGKGRIVKIELI